MYNKFLPKTQSLEIVDETAINNINISNQNCFESISEEIYTDSTSNSDDKPKTSKITHPLEQISARPIFPNLTYSPYGSPRITRKPPKESRSVSIDKKLNGSFLQLNQYKLMDQIGVGSYGLVKLAYNEGESKSF
jgi:[calcium/calmodulin-dependent protein kinase] kinase